MSEAVKIGPLLRTIQSEAVHAYQAKDQEAVKQAISKYNALKELLGNIRKTLDTSYDNATSGFSDATWLLKTEQVVVADDGSYQEDEEGNPVTRLVDSGVARILSDTPRGRVAVAKPDPADMV